MEGSVKVSTMRKPRESTIIKLRQLARCSFATGNSMPLIILN